MAADVITRFKLETTQFDSKLRDTAKQLQSIARQAEKAGKDFSGFDKGAIEAARALGTVASGATNAKDKLRDLVGSFNDAAKAYNALSEEAKKGEFGKAMAASLQKLQQDIKQTKEELYGLGDAAKGKGGGGLFSGMGDKMSGALQVFAGNMLTKAAGAVANLGSEMMDMVQQGVELAKQGEGIRIAFERLGRGDILQGLREATHGTVTDLELMKAAVKFNDFKLPVEELGTMLAFAQQKAKDTGQSVDYMVDSIVTGLGRKSLMILDNLGLSATEVKEKMKETGDMTKAVGEIIREQMAKAGEYVETAADRAAQANVSLQNKMEELGRKFAPVEEASSQLWTSMKIGILDIIGGPLATLINQLTEAGRLKNALNDINGTGSNTKLDRMLGNLRNASEGNRQSIYQQQQAEIWKYINSRENYFKDRGSWVNTRDEGLRQSLVAREKSFGTSNVNDIKAQIGAAKQLLADYKAGAKDILNPAAAISSAITGGDKSGKGGSTTTKVEQTEMQTLQKQIQELEQEYIKLGGITTEDANKRRSEIQSEIAANETKINQIKLLQEQSHGRLQGGSVSTEGISANFAFDGESLQKNLDYVLDQIKVKPIVVPLETTKNNIEGITKAAKTTAQVVGTIGQAFNAIEDPAAKVAAVVAQAIANVALAYSQALAKDVGSKFNIFGFIAASASAMISMATTIASIHQATGYAEGGIVKGNSYSGDNMMFGGDGLYGLNAGELVLTKAQQGSLAQSLQNGGGQTVRVVGKLAGKDLFICAENWAKSVGKGEFVTW
jgi:hypothetical protein